MIEDYNTQKEHIAWLNEDREKLAAQITTLTSKRAIDKKIIEGQTLDECECEEALKEYDAEGITLIERIKLCVSERDEARERCRTLEEKAGVVVKDIDALVENSGGVYGLHLNGDEAPWVTLIAGGCYEDWLVSVEMLRAVLPKTDTTSALTPEGTQPQKESTTKGRAGA